MATFPNRQQLKRQIRIAQLFACLSIFLTCTVAFDPSVAPLQRVKTKSNPHNNVSALESKLSQVSSINSRSLTSKAIITTTQRSIASYTRHYSYSSPYVHDDNGRERDVSITAGGMEVKRPTQALASRISSPPSNPKPKIIVLGATGRLGRRIVKRLMSLKHVDMTVVAFARNYDKACEVLFDDGLLSEHDDSSSKSKKKGPKLQLVVGNLVPPEEVYGYSVKEEDDDEDDDDVEIYGEEYSISASQFYKNDVSDYDYRHTILKEDLLPPDPNQILKDAIKDCTVIISAVGTVRPTVPFSDYIIKPWRIFKTPRKWCKDPNHPFYVNYHVMKKVLEYAELEQSQREVQMADWLKDQEEMETEALRRGFTYRDGNTSSAKEMREKGVDKIRIVRISDLCVANPAWDFLTVLTNIGRSIVFRYQDRCEKILDESKLVDTIVLRPGDLKDEERDLNTTSLQVDTSGFLPSPAYVGYDCVAALTTAAALTKLVPDRKKTQFVNPEGKVVEVNKSKERKSKKKERDTATNDDEEGKVKKAKHFTVAVRWAGEALMQGQKKDGLSNAQACMDSVVKEEDKKDKRRRRKKALERASPISRLIAPVKSRLNQRRAKPYGLFVFLPMLLTYPIIVSMIWSVLRKIPRAEAAAVYILARLRPLWLLLFEYIKIGLMRKSSIPQTIKF